VENAKFYGSLNKERKTWYGQQERLITNKQALTKSKFSLGSLVEKKTRSGILGFYTSIIIKICFREMNCVEFPLRYDFRIFFSIQMKQVY
jgi:hypothetical protein